MGKVTTSFIVAIIAVAIGFVAMRSTETLRFVGDEANPGILNLFKNAFIRNKVANSASAYHDSNTRLADGSVSCASLAAFHLILSPSLRTCPTLHTHAK